MIHEYAAIDPMALLFPSRIYISMSERLHPHVPKAVGEVSMQSGPFAGAK